ncbi:MAG: hypothetical protein IJ588_12535 [Prevotella sp.]|nr:hypothetical protein [Prevotella sp.]
MPVSENDTNRVYTVGDWLFGCVNFAVPQSAVDAICAQRGVEAGTEYGGYIAAMTSQSTEEDAPLPDIRLLKADLYKWIVLGPGKVNNTSDSDNGWSHSEGGYSLSKDDKKLLMGEANAIYEELEPESVFGKRQTKVHSRGIMPAMRSLDGEPLPRVLL